MAYGLLIQEDFWLSCEIDGGRVKTQSMMLILAPIDDHNLYSNGRTVARPVTVSVVEHPRKRPISLPVVRIRVSIFRERGGSFHGPSCSRSFIGWR